MVELGQLFNGSTVLEHPVPAIMEAALSRIDEEYGRVWWNTTQREYPSPFCNWGPEANLKTDVFEVQAYSWGDDEQPYNFAWRDLRIAWYKWYGRGTTANMEITPEMAAQCLDECLKSVRALEPKETDND